MRNRSGCDSGEAGGARTVALALVVFFLGVGAGALWFFAGAQRGPAGTAGEAGPPAQVVLSEPTRKILQRLDPPVQIRFYVILDSAAGGGLALFAGRVDQLLAAYQQEAGGKIKVTRCDAQAYAEANAALADGITAFDQDKGNACYLGVALEQGGRKESLPRLQPEWEPALEADLTRAIARLNDASKAAQAVPVGRNNAATIEEVKRLVPNLDAISREEATRLLREAALKEFRAAATELNAQVKEAEDRFEQAQKTGAEIERQAALKRLQEAQAQQAERLKQIAAKSQEQIEALEQLKR